jgi:hypothetical protein
MERAVAHQRKSDIRKTRTQRTRRAPVQKKRAPVQVPLQLRAAFANYLLHGLTPDQARMRIAEDMAKVAGVPHLAGG